MSASVAATPLSIAVDRLAGFPHALREAGLAIDPNRVIHFLDAVRVARLGTIDDLARIGRVTLTGSPQDFPIFDALFETWFCGRPGNAIAPLSDDEEQVPRSDRPRSGEALIELAEGDTSGKAAAEDLSRGRKTFARLAQDDRAALARIKRRLDHLPTLKSRTWRASPRGPRIDLAGTGRSARRTFGETLRVMRMKRPHRPRRVLLLIDVSGSMKSYSEAGLRVAQLLTVARPKVETFCFGTRLSRVTSKLKRKDAQSALDQLADLVFDFDGGTMIGPSLREFLAVSRNAALVRGAVTVVISDGLERGDPAAMVQAVERLARLSHRLVWATPLAADPRYRPATRAMAAILPSLDAIVDASSYAALDEMLARLEAIDRGPRHEARRQFSRNEALQ